MDIIWNRDSGMKKEQMKAKYLPLFKPIEISQMNIFCRGCDDMI